MHNLKGLPILLRHRTTWTSKTIWSFIDTNFNLLLDYFDDLIIYPVYRNISFDHGMCSTVGWQWARNNPPEVSHSLGSMLLLLLAPWWEIAQAYVLLAIRNLRIDVHFVICSLVNFSEVQVWRWFGRSVVRGERDGMQRRIRYSSGGVHTGCTRFAAFLY